MQFNYYFLKALSAELSGYLTGKKVSSIFSQNKDELIICFEKNGAEFFVKANLESQVSLLSFPKMFARARKNSVDLFTELYGQEVTKVRQFLNERSFAIEFTNGFELLFKLHGRHANILLFQNKQLNTLFKKSLSKDLELNIDSLDRAIDQSDEAIMAADFDLFQVYPTFDRSIKSYLVASGFYDEEDSSKRLTILHDLIDELNDGHFYVLNDAPILKLLKPEEEHQSFTSAIEASNHLAREFFTNQGVAQVKHRLLAQIQKEIKKSESYIDQNTSKLAEIENRRGYDELANILMANLHVDLPPSSTSIELFDFYSNEQIKIKLNPNLSLQLNAENLYRKAKNQSKEIEILKSNISAKRELLRTLEARLQEIGSTEDIKDLKNFEKPTSNSQTESSPFMEYNIEGFQVFAGKNSKNNDLLNQKFELKDDLG